ncbi:MAG: dodecin family protein [Armatimonadota bacterium]|nr:dodecin family protein [Armatimonadota bacterium]
MPVIKVIELVGISNESWEKAVEAAVREASKTIRNIQSVSVGNFNCVVEDGKITEWHVDTSIAFQIEDQLRHEHHEHHAEPEKAHI